MEIEGIIEAILFAAGEPVPIKRISALLDVGEEEVEAAAKRLRDGYKFEVRGIRLVRLDGALQLCSAPEYHEYVRRALEVRKPPKLSSAALEVLAVVAYHQPVTRTYIEQVRGVDSTYTVGILTERGLIEECGRLDVPGRPAIFRTTAAFLRSFGISELSELPKLSEEGEGREHLDIESAIEELKQKEAGNREEGG